MVNFLDATVSLIVGIDTTDLYFKPTDSHQYLHFSSCHPYHCKKGIPYKQVPPVNRICSDPHSFNRGCNDLEKWLKERGYREREIRKQILRAIGFSIDPLLDKENAKEEQKKLSIWLFLNVKKILTVLYLLLTPDVAHKTCQ